MPKPRGDQWWLSAMGVQKAWEQSTGRGVTIALIDSRPNLDLPEFDGADVREGDKFNKRQNPALKGGIDKHHGTGMLAAIAAQGGGSGYVGVAPDVTVLAVSITALDRSELAIRYAIDQGADVVSMSFSSVNPVINDLRCDADLEDVIAYAAERDVVLVAAAGNNRSDSNLTFQPAMCPGVVAVGGLSRKLKPRKKALEQDYIAVAAPSEKVFGLSYSGAAALDDGGTSTATAYTSAAVALLRAKHPGESARQIVSRLLYTAQDVHTPGRDDFTGYGLIRPDRAMTAEVPAGFANPVYDRLDAFTKKQAERKELLENPPPFTVGGDPEDRREITSDRERYGPWLIGGLLFTLAAAVSGLLVFRRKRRTQQQRPQL
ncbi:S8 family serine peptidase [Actinocorallia populi]|uniref:S8 family serine peptidase n=1 Tax=Actinocorallia populi TaxID=2079200 RepID=UPI0013003937|nr:S8 family serine peptidase [Actinocorallia populi]